MGEMADIYNEQVIDEMDEGYYDEEDSMFHGYQGLHKPIPKMCIHCKTKNLFWKETELGWRLADSNSEVHTCDQYKRAIVDFVND